MAWPHAKRTSRGASSQMMHRRASVATAGVSAPVATAIASSRSSTSDSGMRSSSHCSVRPVAISARQIATASSQLPASASGTPGACQRLGCVGHFCM
eukprot:scaffold43973_cov59-Phaeocystis_antarctica.AAC.4